MSQGVGCIIHGYLDGDYFVSLRAGRVYSQRGMETDNLKPNRFVCVFTSHAEADAAELAYWRTLSPEERLDAVGECVRHYLALKNEPEQRFCRVYKVLDRQEG